LLVNYVATEASGVAGYLLYTKTSASMTCTMMLKTRLRHGAVYIYAARLK
jgi:hypothetical protein